MAGRRRRLRIKLEAINESSSDTDDDEDNDNDNDQVTITPPATTTSAHVHATAATTSAHHHHHRNDNDSNGSGIAERVRCLMQKLHSSIPWGASRRSTHRTVAAWPTWEPSVGAIDFGISSAIQLPASVATTPSITATSSLSGGNAAILTPGW
jgi:hypothetical protein